MPAIAWHELAHAKDFSRRNQQASYSLAYSTVPIWHETIATQDVMSFVAGRGDREEIASAVEVLYPAYATYAGSSASAFGGELGLPLYYGTVIAAHANARMLSRQIRGGEDLGPITSVATSSFYDQYDALDGEIWTGGVSDEPLAALVQPGFRDIPKRSKETSSSAGVLSMNFDPEFGIRLPDGQTRELGDQWGIGLRAALDLDTFLDRPYSIRYAGNSSDSSATWSSTTLDPSGFDARYSQDFHDLLIGYRVDANGADQDIHPMSDQILLGFRYLYFADQIDDRVSFVPAGFSGLRNLDSEFSATNQVFAPSLEFQRRFRYGRWTARGQVGGFAGLVRIDQSSMAVATDTFGRRSQSPVSESRSVGISTGQDAELAIGVGSGSTWQVEAGVRAINLTGVATSIRDYVGDGIDDTTDILGVGGFVGVRAEF